MTSRTRIYDRLNAARIAAVLLGTVAVSSARAEPRPEATSPAAPSIMYSNFVTASNWYSGQAGNEAIDDIHGITPGGTTGTLTRIRFKYTDKSGLGAPGRDELSPRIQPATIDATVYVYGNPGGYDLGLTPIGGPYIVSNLPFGTSRTAIVDIVGGPEVGPHLWIGIQFNSAATGLQIADTPTIGSSHDFYLQNGNFLYFGGAPKANFAIEVTVDLNQTGVRDRTPGLALDLSPAFPNPFRERTAISFELPETSPVEVAIFDSRGTLVRRLMTGVQQNGPHLVTWDGLLDDGTRALAGVYFVRLQSEFGTPTRKIVLLAR